MFNNRVPVCRWAAALFPFVLILSGCPRILSIDYQPSNTIKGEGTIQIGPFRYMPFENGQVHAKQVQLNTQAAGSLYLSEDVAAFFAEALRRELVSSGYQVEPEDQRSLGGSVDQFYLDWIDAAEMTFDMSVTYIVRHGDRVVYTDKVSCQANRPKSLMADSAIIRDATKECIIQFIQTAQGAKAL
jgi:hypothetical protein